MKDIVVIGAGGFGREVEWLIEDINKTDKSWNFLGFIDENVRVGQKIGKSSVIGDLSWFKTHKCHAILAIGNPLAKATTIEKIHAYELSFPILIHPSVIMSSQVTLGEGSVICAGCILTTNILIGKHVIINLDCTIGHDAIIDDFSTVLPSVNISGFVKVGKKVSLGTGTQIIQNIEVGENTIVGAGSVVVKSLPSHCTAVGVPAKVIKTSN